MNILNQKEEVLKVELTKHGRKLLGMGIFQPKYFSFFDDSIIYDNSYAGISEENVNKIQDRILNDSLTFSFPNLSVETLENELGTSDIFNDKAPAWDLKLLNGKISYLSGLSTNYKKIFNVNDITYYISPINNNPEDIKIEEDYVLIDLKELNLQDELHNFEIEVVTYDELSGGKVTGLEKKLKFSQFKTNIIDGLLFEDNELPYNYFNVDINEEDVPYYLDILVDDEIDTDFIISTEKKLQERIRGTYTSTNVPDVCEPCCDDNTEPC